MIGLLIWLLVFALIVYVVYMIVGMLGLPETVRNIVCLILAIVFVLVLLRQLGVLM